MKMQNKDPFSLADLTALVEVYGANRARWPDEVQDCADELLAESAQARQVLAEARALDRLLDEARPYDSGGQEPLAARIVAAALAEGQARPQPKHGRSTSAAEASEDNVIAWPGRQQHAPQIARPIAQETWRSAALLAASLLLGVYIGFANGSTAFFQDAAEVAGINVESETGLAALGLSDMTGLDEEAL